jgi:hypothetical protein
MDTAGAAAGPFGFRPVKEVRQQPSAGHGAWRTRRSDSGAERFDRAFGDPGVLPLGFRKHGMSPEVMLYIWTTV